MRIGGRGPFGLVLRRCLAAVWLPTLLAALAGLVLQRAAPPQLADAAAATAAVSSPWLMLPLLVAAIGAAVTAVRFWPPFAAQRPGAETLRRLQRGPLAGNGATIAGALTAQLALTSLVLGALAGSFGAPAARAHVEPRPAREGLLLPGTAPLTFTAADGPVCRTLLLRPHAGLPDGPITATRLEVRADGELLTTAPLACVEDRQLLRFDFAPRSVHELTITATAGTVPLWLPRGAVVLVGDAERPWPLNAALVALIGLVPTFAALALALLGGRVAALPTVTTVVVAILFVSIAGELGPLPAAVRALLRGQWLPASPVFPASIPSLLVGSLAMILSMSWPAGSRR
ncbi:MAG: hypothetical protein JNN13_19995 [Planctomycetes bacterium]|nr:hypothetical protein [Planctomycetota bacterium]